MNENQAALPDRAKREIAHGEYLAAEGAEYLWGWAKPAGKVRYLRRAAMIAEAAGLGRQGMALEIGCGTGLFTEVFARSAMKIKAVDISPHLIKIASTRLIPSERAEFVCARFEQIESSELYDAIIGSSVLHHLELAEALARIFCLLKPGGRLVMAEPNMLNPQIFAERTFLRPVLKQVSQDETAFIRWRLAALLRRQGFEDINIRPFDWLHPAVPVGLIKPVAAFGRLLEKIPFLKELAGSLLVSAQKPR